MKLIYITLIVLLLLSSTFAQSVKQLEEKLNNGTTSDALESILEAGKSGNKTFIPYLKKLALQPADSINIHTISSYAQIALAGLGEKAYLSAIIGDVDNENIFLQNVAIQKLALVGGKPAFKVFFQLLDDKEYRVEKLTPQDERKIQETGQFSRKGDEVLEPRSFLVMRLLSKMTDNPPVPCDVQPSEKEILIWKEWFGNHRYLIE